MCLLSLRRSALVVGLAGCLLGGMLGVPATAAAALPVGVIVNGLKITFPDTRPYVDSNDRTMVPIRFISEQLNAKVVWSPNQPLTIQYGSRLIELPLNKPLAKVNGKEIKLDTEAVTVGGRTMVPIRFIGEAFGIRVEWDKEAYTVRISDEAFEKSGRPVDAWGRLLRTDHLPGNAADWAYILEDVPNAAYNMAYRKRTDPSQPRLLPVETMSNPHLTRESIDAWVMRIREYYDLALNVDYRTIEPSSWWESFASSMNGSSIDSETRTRYAEWVQENHIRLEGWADPEPSMLYWQDGKYIMRSKLRFRILESDTSYGTLLDTFDSSYEVRLKPGVWYSGYADIALSTNTTGNPWPNYGVDQHDHLFFSPIGTIQEEVSDAP